MKIYVERTYKKEKYTIGKMYIDGEYFCDTLEDTVRPKGVKIYGETAIPASTYKVVLSYSPKFKRVLPEVLSVPMFTGIRIHRGNWADHEEFYKKICVNHSKSVFLSNEIIEVI